MYGFTPSKKEEKEKPEGGTGCSFTPVEPKNVTPVVNKTVKAWSFSSLLTYEKCPYQTFLKSVKRSPEPPNEFSDRGTTIHTLAEEFTEGKIAELPPELKKLERKYEGLKEQYADGKVQLEGEWGFDNEWEPTGWFAKDTWARIKADALVLQDETSGVVIDHKTGKKFGNEIKHNQQLQLYAIGTFLMFPKMEYIEAELWYIDQGQTTTNKYTREEAMMFLPRWTERGTRMTTETEFAPRPSKSNCNYCPYRKTGACDWAVEA